MNALCLTFFTKVIIFFRIAVSFAFTLAVEQLFRQSEHGRNKIPSVFLFIQSCINILALKSLVVADCVTVSRIINI